MVQGDGAMGHQRVCISSASKWENRNEVSNGVDSQAEIESLYYLACISGAAVLEAARIRLNGAKRNTSKLASTNVLVTSRPCTYLSGGL